MHPDGFGAEAAGPWHCSYLFAYPHLWLVSWRYSVSPSRTYFAWNSGDWRYRCEERQALKAISTGSYRCFYQPGFGSAWVWLSDSAIADCCWGWGNLGKRGE